VRVAVPPQCPWVSSIGPPSGTIPAGGSQQVDIGVDANGLDLGTYECYLRIASNAANNNQLFVPITLIVGTPVERIDDLIAKVQALKVAGVLNKGRANALIVKLKAARKNIGRGHINPAINELGAFINQVNAFVNSGILTSSQGDELVSAANVVIDLLQNSLLKSGITELAKNEEIPDVYELEQNYPNPFNPSTVIRYGVPEDAKVTLAVYDILGSKVAELVNGNVAAGIHEVVFDASNLSSGIYFYRLSAGSFTQINKMLLLK
jgi:hypothetical protein